VAPDDGFPIEVPARRPGLEDELLPRRSIESDRLNCGVSDPLPAPPDNSAHRPRRSLREKQSFETAGLARRLRPHAEFAR